MWSKLLRLILALSFALPPGAWADSSGGPSLEERSEASSPVAPLFVYDEKNQSVVAVSQQENLSPQAVREFLENLPAERKSDVIISTDSVEVLKESVEWSEKQTEDKKAHFLPFGELLTNQVWNTAKAVKKIGQNSLNSIKNDTIGMMVTVVVTSYDSYVWIHSQNGSIEQKTAMIFMNLVMAATFGLDKDLWTRTTKPIEKKFIKVLSRFKMGAEISKDKTKSASSLASRFLANATLSLGIQLTRVSFYSIDSLTTAVTTASFWANTAMMGTILAFSSFGWSEQLADISEVKNPAAKFALRRWNEIRGLILSYTSPSSKVLQTDIYGISPLLILVGNGVIGFLAWQGSTKLIPWLEGRPALRLAREKSAQIFTSVRENFLKHIIKTAAPITCSALFN